MHVYAALYWGLRRDELSHMLDGAQWSAARRAEALT